MTQGTLTIIAPDSEERFMEACLNQTASGFDVTLAFGLYAMVNGLHITKFIYYKDLIDEVEDSYFHGFTLFKEKEVQNGI